jgi:hypothetical protein
MGLFGPVIRPAVLGLDDSLHFLEPVSGVLEEPRHPQALVVPGVALVKYPVYLAAFFVRIYPGQLYLLGRCAGEPPRQFPEHGDREDIGLAK